MSLFSAGTIQAGQTNAPRLREQIPLILDADSSQHSALIDALKGKNLVIEGPPGTGKSQTITNLIAAALSNGKTVLFVSEKLAALEVIRRRLDAAGLGMFCLELHSHKTKKQALISDIKDRLVYKDSFREPQDLKNQLAIVEDRKQRLTQYVNTVNKELDGFDRTIFQSFWAREKALLQLPSATEIQGRIAEVASYSSFDIAERRHLLTVYADHFSSIAIRHPSIQTHPWHWVANPVRFEIMESVQDRVDAVCDLLAELQAVTDEINDDCGLHLAFNLKQIDGASHYLETITPPPAELDVALFGQCADGTKWKALREMLQDLNSAAAALSEFRAIIGNGSSVGSG